MPEHVAEIRPMPLLCLLLWGTVERLVGSDHDARRLLDFFDRRRAVAHGFDGSRAIVTFHAHFTVNANGETTVQLETDRLVCT
jgi:hypothetical protein